MRYRFGDFEFDEGRQVLLREGKPVTAGVRGLALLGALLANRGQPVAKEALLDAAWPGQAVAENNLTVQIAALRRLLGSGPGGASWIATVQRGGYRFDDGHARDALAAQLPTPAKRPSILVEPFANASGDATQDYLASGITDDLTVALSRYRWFEIAASPPAGASTDYVVSGSLRKHEVLVRIAVKLIDVANRSTVWAERYQVEYTDMFAIQDAIAERIAGALEPELLKSESLHAVSLHTGNMTAWDLVRQGMWHFHRIAESGHARALALFRQAAESDPGLPEAHIWLARVLGGTIFFGWSADTGAAYAEGVQAARQAILLDERNPYAHYALAIVSAFSGHVDQAVRAAERAIEISPSFALAHLVHGLSLLFSGRSAEATPALEHGLALSPHDPHNFVWLALASLARLDLGDAAGARRDAVLALKIRPEYRLTLKVLSCCEAMLGNGPQAAASFAAMQRLPGDGIDILGMLSHGNPRLADLVQDLLDRAARG